MRDASRIEDRMQNSEVVHLLRPVGVFGLGCGSMFHDLYSERTLDRQLGADLRSLAGRSSAHQSGDDREYKSDGREPEDDPHERPVA